MRHTRGVMTLLAFCGAAAVAAPVAPQWLDIPPRLQWDENAGYCGECSVQQMALRFGTWVSQAQARAINDPTQEQDLWIEHAGPVLDALRLTYEPWDFANEREPQFRRFMLWMKQHLHAGHPVMFGVYYRGSDEWSPDYDHIVPAVGVKSSNWDAYRPADKLWFHDNYSRSRLSRRFDRLVDTRPMRRNGARYSLCVPKWVDYGCAVTGIRDDLGETVPVAIDLDRWDEPNVIAGEEPRWMDAAVTASGLTPGREYRLLRYDDPAAVPTRDFLASSWSAAHDFTAETDTWTYADRFMSDRIVIYRCVPVGP